MRHTGTNDVDISLACRQIYMTSNHAKLDKHILNEMRGKPFTVWCECLQTGYQQWWHPVEMNISQTQYYSPWESLPNNKWNAYENLRLLCHRSITVNAFLSIIHRPVIFIYRANIATIECEHGINRVVTCSQGARNSERVAYITQCTRSDQCQYVGKTVYIRTAQSGNTLSLMI
jgi:hypothetical protein